MAGKAEVLSHWDTLIPEFQTSSLEFYDKVEAAIGLRQIPETKVERVTHKEGGLGSASRVYLRVRRGKLAFDICSAQYGTGHFFSSWMTQQPPQYALLVAAAALIGVPLCFLYSIYYIGIIQGPLVFLAVLGGIAFVAPTLAAGSETIEDILSALPYLGPLYRKYFKPVTYYVSDTQRMFQKSVQLSVTQTVDELLNGQGLRALSPDQLHVTSIDPLK